MPDSAANLGLAHGLRLAKVPRGSLVFQRTDPLASPWLSAHTHRDIFTHLRLGQCPSTVRPVFPNFVSNRAVLGQPPQPYSNPTEPYSDKDIPLRRALRRFAFLVGLSTGNPPKIWIFTAWNRTRNRTRTPSDRWPGDSQRKLGRFARIDSQKKPYFRTRERFARFVSNLRFALLSPPPPEARFATKKGVQFGHPETIRANLRIDSRELGHLSYTHWQWWSHCSGPSNLLL